MLTGGALSEPPKEVKVSRTPVQLSEHVYMLGDTCNVYLLTDGDAALAIDFGSGGVLDHLQGLGVKQLEWVLHTHYHRDQCQGDERAVAAGARLAVPEAEREYFENVEELWATGKLPGGIFGPQHLARRSNVPVSRGLVPGEAFQWRGYRFTVLATPGQTPDSLTLVAEIDGRRFAFSGDLIAAAGKVWDFGQLQWSYLHYEGLQALRDSVETVRQAEPDLLCPSHGAVMEDPQSALTELELRSGRVAELVVRPNIGRWNWSDLVQVSPHLLKDAGTTSYIILSDDGHALFFDLGVFKPELFQTLRERFGVETVDAVVISHFHWDHTGGIPELVEKFGSEVWALDVQQDILEHPQNYLMSFANNGVPAIRADRYFHDGEGIDWRGHRLTFMHLPAHTRYHLGMLATVDGKPTLFTADAVGHTAGNELSASFVCGNRIFLGRGALVTARQVNRYAPYLVCPAHSDPFVALKEMRRRYVGWALQAQDAIGGLIAQPHPEMGFDPYWVRVEPYLITVRPGEETPCRLVVRNHLPLAAEVAVELRLPPGLSAEPVELAGPVDPGAERSFSFTLKCGKDVSPGRGVLGVDVTFAGRHWGELTEAIVQVGE